MHKYWDVFPFYFRLSELEQSISANVGEKPINNWKAIKKDALNRWFLWLSILHQEFLVKKTRILLKKTKFSFFSHCLVNTFEKSGNFSKTSVHFSVGVIFRRKTLSRTACYKDLYRWIHYIHGKVKRHEKKRFIVQWKMDEAFLWDCEK